MMELRERCCRVNGGDDIRCQPPVFGVGHVLDEAV